MNRVKIVAFMGVIQMEIHSLALSNLIDNKQIVLEVQSSLDYEFIVV